MDILKILLTFLVCCYFTDNAGGPNKYRGEIHAEALKHGIPTEIAMRLVAVESSFRPCVTSSAGAVGLAQVLPTTAQMYEPDITKVGLCNPSTNLHVAFSYLEDLLALYDGDMMLALSAYNMGPGNMERYGRPVTHYAHRVYGD